MDDPRQPGPYIRRVGGRVLTDEEMLQYYSGLAREFRVAPCLLLHRLCWGG